MYDVKDCLDKLEQNKLAHFISTIQLNAIQCIASKKKNEVCLSMPGTHDLLEIIGETLCLLIESNDANSMMYKINLEELVELSNLKIEFSMNVIHGIVNFMQKANRTKSNESFRKIIFENFHKITYNSILEWKSLNHSFNLKTVSYSIFEKFYLKSLFICILF